MSRRRVRIPIVTTALMLFTAIGGCSAIGGEPDAGTAPRPVEKAKVKVGLLPVIDTAGRQAELLSAPSPQ